MKPREIKFRAWDGEKMHSEFVLLDPEWILKKNIGCPVNEGFKCLADNWIVMQFTGLHDKNGKEIWEGDIANISHRFVGGSSYTERGVMTWDEKQARFGFPISESILDEEFLVEIEIIGNIHEHPHLLTGGTG